jgi:hypothetical protein
MKGKKIKVILHVLAWAIILGLPLFIVKQWKLNGDFLWFYYVVNIISFLIFYINYLILVPRLYFHKQKRNYFLSVLGMLVFFYFVSSFSGELVFRRINAGKPEDMRRSEERFDRGRGGAEDNVRPGPPTVFPRLPFRHMHLLNFTFTSFFLVFFSLGIRALEKEGEIEKIQGDLEKEKLNSELALLKNQISPHFFFNTLNNIYSLIGINQEDSQKAVLKLSKLMRYLLYESEQGKVALSNEIDFMKNYIDLMKLRMNERVNLTVKFPENYEDIHLPPLLFIPFIENAFKHGITNKGKSFIEIELISLGKEIEFNCLNSIGNGKTEDRQSGIGLENVTKRLNLLFPGKHDLKIGKNNDKFEVHLVIQTA